MTPMSSEYEIRYQFVRGHLHHLIIHRYNFWLNEMSSIVSPVSRVTSEAETLMLNLCPQNRLGLDCCRPENEFRHPLECIGIFGERVGFPQSKMDESI